MSVLENIQHVQSEILAACQRVQRDPHSLTLIAVSKNQPDQLIYEALEAGLSNFGENRPEIAPDRLNKFSEYNHIVWHMIGHVQSRKAALIPGYFQMCHSIDRFKIAQKLDDEVARKQASLDVLLEINISGEASKQGFFAHEWQTRLQIQDNLLTELNPLFELQHINICGLMTMAPYTNDQDQIRPVFASLRELRDWLQIRLDRSLPHLSMGMSNDYPIAIEEGATLIRVGTAIFDENRTY